MPPGGHTPDIGGRPAWFRHRQAVFKNPGSAINFASLLRCPLQGGNPVWEPSIIVFP